MAEHVEATVEPNVLKDCVFVVSLIRVLTDAFGSSKDLYHKLKQKSDCDDEHEGMEDAKQKSSRDRRDSHSNLSEILGRHVRWSLDRRDTHRSDSEDELICTASQQIQATYDRGYQKLGEVYARGDSTAKIQLQSHIIKLQQVLIRIHQDFMLSNYLAVSSSHSQLIQLVQTVRTTRAAAIQALDLLCQRLLASPPAKDPRPHLPMPGAFPPPPPSRCSSISDPPDANIPVPPKPPINPHPNTNKLFCPYALSLQDHPHRPLSHAFSLGGTNRCPACFTHLPTRPNKAWEVIVDSCGRGSRGKRFLVRNRFVVKCHRSRGGFACVLCVSCRDADTVCRSLEALMEHLWKEHTSGDMEGDCDILEC